MANQNWQSGKWISLVIIVVGAGIWFSGSRSFLFLKMPNGATVFWQLEPAALKPDPTNK